MSTVPYTFATATGNIPLNQLDTNFSNVKAFANTAGTVTTGAQPNITSVGVLSSLIVSGNVSGANGAFTNLTGTLTTAAQPNISSVGTLTSLTVSGNVTAGNIIGTIIGNITNAVYSTTSGTVTTAAQPNITSVGTLTSLTVSGNIVGGNLQSTGNTSVGGNLTVSSNTVVSGNLTVSSNTVVGGNLNVSNAISGTTLTVTGNVTASNFVDAGNIVLGQDSKIFGYFTAATTDGRTMFQTTSTGTNGRTNITIIPGANNTAANASAFSAYLTSNVGNSAWSSLQQANTEARLISSKNGGGSFLPITVYTSDLERLKVDLAGNVGIGNSTPLDTLSVTGNSYVSGNVTATNFIGNGSQLTNLPAGPIFMAYQTTNQALSTGVANLVYNTETVDSGNYYNVSTGVFTPLVNGYYQVNAVFWPEYISGTANAQFYLGIYKNGSAIAAGTYLSITPTGGVGGPSGTSTLVYLNGSTDYIQCKTISTINSGSWQTQAGIPVYFQAAWIRS